MIRRQLPAYSPVSPVQLGLACLDALRRPDAVLCELEEYLKGRFRADEVVLTGSGTQALQLALELASRRTPGTAAPGAPVALPAYSCFDLVTAAVGAGVSVEFYDIDPVSLAPDRESLRDAIARGAEVVVAGNLYAFPLDWSWLRRECRAVGALLIEDAAQGIGSGWDGAEAGTFGDFTILSFGRGKGWNGGGGGALLARGAGSRLLPELSGRSFDGDAGSGAKAAAVSGALWALGRPLLYRIPTSIPGLSLGETIYKEPGAIRPMPSAISATILRHARVSAAAVECRRRWAAEWRQHAFPGACRPLEGGVCGYLRYPVVTESGEAAARLARAGRDAGVARGYPRALPDLPAAGACQGAPRPDLPGARALAERLLTLPTHPRVSDRDVSAVVRAMA